MASIHVERLVDAPADQVWDAIRDVGALHTRLVPGFVTDTRLEGGARLVTFASGLAARELLVDLDDTRRRFAYSVRADSFTHHSATNEVFEAGPGRSRFVWTADVLPNEMAALVGGMMEQGVDALKATLERGHAPA